MVAAARTRFTELTLAELLSGLGKDGRVGYSGGGALRVWGSCVPAGAD